MMDFNDSEYIFSNVDKDKYYIHGLYLEGGGWDKENKCINE